jgi:adenylate cyclase
MLSDPHSAPESGPNTTYRKVLYVERLKNARRGTMLRATIVSGFFATEMLMVFGLGLYVWHQGTTVLAVYCAVSILIWLVARNSDRLTMASSLAIPILDMPAMFLVFVRTLSIREPGNIIISAPGLAIIYLLMILFAVITLQRWHVALTTVVGLILTNVFAGLSATRVDFRIFLTLDIIAFGLVAMYVIGRLRDLVRVAALQQTRRERLRQHFSPDVAGWVEERGDEDSTDTRTITVLFCDIRGFTGLTQEMSPEQVVALLKEYQGAMVARIFDNGGTLDKFIGDGILAYFNAPRHQPDHASRALRCALSMCTALDELNDRRATRREPTLRIGIGIHTGPATLGTVGTDQRREYTAIGSTVNVAAHIEELTREVGGPILFTESTHQLIEASTRAELLPKTRIRGLSEPISVYRCSP